MGKIPRPKPARLPEKLLQIRASLGLSQNEMIRRLGLSEELYQGSISGYELGTREPPLPVLLKYARLAGISTDLLIDDGIDLPEVLPAIPTYQELIMKRGRARKSRAATGNPNGANLSWALRISTCTEIMRDGGRSAWPMPILWGSRIS